MSGDATTPWLGALLSGMLVVVAALACGGPATETRATGRPEGPSSCPAITPIGTIAAETTRREAPSGHAAPRPFGRPRRAFHPGVTLRPEEAELRAWEVFEPDPRSFYCGCRFGPDKVLDPDACGFVRPDGRPLGPNAVVRWLRVVPPAWMGTSRPCWSGQGCRPGASSRQCCLESDPDYASMEGDLHNLVPVIGALASRIEGASLGEVPGESRAFGTCDVEVAQGVFQPPPELRGDVARVLFYMSAVYRVPIPATDVAAAAAWSRDDPPSDAERARALRIHAVQGNSNPFVLF